MNIKIGTDICLVTRISAAYTRFGDRFLDRILTPAERSYVSSHPALLSKRLAGRFAVKEAASKVLGTGWRGVGWREIEVVKERSGAPRLQLHGRAAALADQLGLKNWQVTLSHDGDYAQAFVLAHD
jgi:holo-[acyl-carrier protein] synthase